MTYLIITIKNNFNGEINLGVTFPDHHTYLINFESHNNQHMKHSKSEVFINLKNNNILILLPIN